ncbi:MAG: alkaline phosphatase family protein [Candidatus Coatesbacteria bacterium]|nr:MAG: alkaline phosphatase family protein [Candidatus Coatesbacteria bacterium]
MKRIIALCLIAGVLAVPANAYVGPGAGFAVVSSFLIILGALALSFISVLTWPVRRIIRTLKRRKSMGKSRVGRVVVLGLDGISPVIVRRMMDEGKLPNFAKLAEGGTFKPLATTIPSISPVAWSSFQTGVYPARHNIYDFLTVDRKTYLPDLSSAHIGAPKRRVKLGKWSIPIGKPEIRLLRKSQPFWKILGDHGIFSTVIRVPVTFPPEKFDGLSLSAMCVPDIIGSQGTFTYFSTRDADSEHTGGVRVRVERDGDILRSHFVGPGDPTAAEPALLRLPFTVKPNGGKKGTVRLEMNGKKYDLKPGEYSDWIPIEFKASLGVKVRGATRLLVRETNRAQPDTVPEFEMYATPINIDPDRPALPISHPFTYAVYLSKLYGRYATLGLAEDTWALNEGVIDEGAFLDQTWKIHNEREKMFFDALEKTRKGLVVCVFDASDRIQHMFWRYLDDDHPANEEKDTTEYADALENMYVRMDELVARTMERLGEDEVLFVISDHGFDAFKRGFNVNGWLRENGFLYLKDDESTGADWFADVDWSRTRAFGLGLGGIFLNVAGRETQGIVNPSDVPALKGELKKKLTGLKDPAGGEVAVDEVYDLAETYSGPYLPNAPDLVIGYTPGYRVSWESVTGKVIEGAFHDNTKRWSGDHCIAAKYVPGIFFCNRPVDGDGPSLVDMAPTIMELFGVEAPGYVEGKPLPVEVSASNIDKESGEDE